MDRTTTITRRGTLARLHALVLMAVATSSGWALAAAETEPDTAPPKYLQLAREVVQNVKPENNSYSNASRYVRLPSDLFSSGYTVHTDCTGFVFDMLERNSYRIRFSVKSFPDRYGIADTVDGIRKNESFERIDTIRNLRMGDVVAWKYMEGPNARGLSGHIVMVNADPVRVEKPTQQATDAGLVMWSVEVLDSSTGPASPDDTRYIQGTSAQDAANALNSAKTQKQTGVGRGRFYLYTDAEGMVKALSYGFRKAPLKYNDVDWAIAMGRPRDRK